MDALGDADDADPSLSNLPCLGSRATIVGWYSVVGEALRDSDHRKVLSLYEAALCLPLRLRCGPSLVQVSLDSITYSEDLFASNSATSDAFLTFAEKLIGALPSGFIASNSARNIVLHAKSIGISFHGSAVGDNVARALMYVAPYLNAPAFRTAFREFEEISSALNDQTNISLLLHSTTKCHAKDGVAATEAAVPVLFALRMALIYKDIGKDTILTKEFLTGTRHKAGFVHWFFKRTALVDFVKCLVVASNGGFAREAKENIFPKLTSLMQMEGHFASEKCKRGYFVKVSSAVGEDDEDEPESEELASVGVLFATMKAFEAFSETLSSSCQLLAKLLWQTHGCSFDEEFRLIANAELAACSFVFPWANLFSPSASATKNPKQTTNKTKEAQSKIGGLSLPLLRDACTAWIDSTLSQPSVLGDTKSAVGDADEAYSMAAKINDEAFGTKRSETIDRLDELFDTKVALTCVPPGTISTHSVLNVLQQSKNRWANVKKV